jgi:hypothetical protein
MAIPYRGVTGHGTYFITSATYQKISIFQTDRMALAPLRMTKL